MPDRCPVTLYETTRLTRRDGERTRPYPCGQPVVRYGLCAKHAGDHERLCDPSTCPFPEHSREAPLVGDVA